VQCRTSHHHYAQVGFAQQSELPAENPAIRAGLNLVAGKVTNRAVADTFGLPYHAL